MPVSNNAEWNHNVTTTRGLLTKLQAQATKRLGIYAGEGSMDHDFDEFTSMAGDVSELEQGLQNLCTVVRVLLELYAVEHPDVRDPQPITLSDGSDE